MARMPRAVIPGFPHHVTQRGNRKQTTFFRSSDYRHYLDLLQEARELQEVKVWAYCLMPNHVHLVLVPGEKTALWRLFREVHTRFTRMINRREGWQGHLWQERFHSFAMDERHLLAAVRYVELNPMRSGLVSSPADWPWSSAAGHLGHREDPILDPSPLDREIGDWNQYLQTSEDEIALDTIRKHARTGRPAGNRDFIRHLESHLGRPLAPRKRGPKKVNCPRN